MENTQTMKSNIKEVLELLHKDVKRTMEHESYDSNITPNLSESIKQIANMAEGASNIVNEHKDPELAYMATGLLAQTIIELFVHHGYPFADSDSLLGSDFIIKLPNNPPETTT